MKIEEKIVSAGIAGLESLYGQQVPEKRVQLQETRSEFDGELTLVVFPFLKISRKKPEDTAQELGEYLLSNVPEIISRFNLIKGFINLSKNLFSTNCNH